MDPTGLVKLKKQVSWSNQLAPGHFWLARAETNSLHLENGGWESTFILGCGLFLRAKMLVLGRVRVLFSPMGFLFLRRSIHFGLKH